jgi:hypothetical protein
MNDKDRCKGCGSWEAQCSFDIPQEGCYCASLLQELAKAKRENIRRKDELSNTL